MRFSRPFALPHLVASLGNFSIAKLSKVADYPRVVWPNSDMCQSVSLHIMNAKKKHGAVL